MNCLNKKEVKLEQLIPIIVEQLELNKSIHFSPMGYSMLPMIRQGIDSVVLIKTNNVKKYDVPLVEYSKGRYILHRVIKINADDTFDTMGDNCFNAERNIKKEQIVAVMKGFYRGDKYYSANYLPYRIYSFVWHHTRILRRIKRKLKNLIRRGFGEK